VPVSPNITATYSLLALARGTTDYWRIVSKTMANETKSGPVWNFGLEIDSWLMAHRYPCLKPT